MLVFMAIMMEQYLYKQMAEMEASSHDMLAEAMQRAMSGGRPNSLGKFMKKLESNDF